MNPQQIGDGVNTSSWETRREDATNNRLPEQWLAPKIEIARSRHEVRIRRALIRWQRQGSPAESSAFHLGEDQLSELATLVTSMWQDLGSQLGREQLARSMRPPQLDVELRRIAEEAADNAQLSWEALISRFRSQDGDGPTGEHLRATVRERVFREMMLVNDRLMLDAWAAHARRLQAVRAGAATRSASAERPNAVPSRLQENVRQRRMNAGLSLEALAIKADIDKKTLSRVEAGNQNPYPRTLLKIARALDVSVSDLQG